MAIPPEHNLINEERERALASNDRRVSNRNFVILMLAMVNATLGIIAYASWECANRAESRAERAEAVCSRVNDLRPHPAWGPVNMESAAERLTSRLDGMEREANSLTRRTGTLHYVGLLIQTDPLSPSR